MTAQELRAIQSAMVRRSTRLSRVAAAGALLGMCVLLQGCLVATVAGAAATVGGAAVGAVVKGGAAVGKAVIP